MLKTLIATALMISLILPITRQFFLPFLPIGAWLVLWYSCKYVISTFSHSCLFKEAVQAHEESWLTVFPQIH